MTMYDRDWYREKIGNPYRSPYKKLSRRRGGRKSLDSWVIAVSTVAGLVLFGFWLLGYFG